MTDDAEERRARARDTLYRMERTARRLAAGWSRPLDYFEMSRDFLSNDAFDTRSWLTESLALWTSTSSAWMGCEGDSDEGLDFRVDEYSESAGPRYIPRPKWMSGPDVPVVESVILVDDSQGELGKENIMVRFEDDRLSVTLVSLKDRQPKLATAHASAVGTPSGQGKYKILFAGGEEPIPFQASANAAK